MHSNRQTKAGGSCDFWNRENQDNFSDIPAEEKSNGSSDIIQRRNVDMHSGPSFFDEQGLDSSAAPKARRTFRVPPVISTCRVCGSQYTRLKWRQFRQGTQWRYVVSKSTVCGSDCQRRFYRDDQTRKTKIGLSTRGKKHWNWKGGISQINSLSKRGPDWAVVAEAVRVKAGRICQGCTKSESENGRKLDVHHITPFHDCKTTADANKTANLEALCKSCHTKKEHANRNGSQMILALGGQGRGGYARGESVNTNKLTEIQVREIVHGSSDGRTGREMAKTYGVRETTISAILTGKTWKHIKKS